MYQIIDCESHVIIFESENLDRAIERFEMIKAGIPPCILFSNPFPDIDGMVLQKAERVDQWYRQAK
jgi:hypothetical protein